MLLAAAQKLGAGLSTSGLAGHRLGIGVGVGLAGLLISKCFNPIEFTFCDPFSENNIFNTGVIEPKLPIKIFLEFELKKRSF
jgi:hypothetical protein